MSLSPGFVKICGVQAPEHIDWVVGAGATAVGLNFSPASSRRVTSLQGKLLADHARSLPADLLLVGVFLDATPDAINQIVDEVGLDIAQIHLRDKSFDLTAIASPVIPVLHPSPDDGSDAVRAGIDRILATRSDIPAVLFDAWSATTIGGSGQLGNWDLAAQLTRDYPIILAGGLSPDNVARAIAEVHPIGVDVASGVETDKVKDADKINSFVANARSAFPGTS